MSQQTFCLCNANRKFRFHFGTEHVCLNRSFVNRKKHHFLALHLLSFLILRSRAAMYKITTLPRFRCCPTETALGVSCYQNMNHGDEIAYLFTSALLASIADQFGAIIDPRYTYCDIPTQHYES